MANGLFNLKQVIQAVQQGGWSNQKTPAVEYLVVAGGGGTGYNWGSAGGAGGLLQGLASVPNGQTLLVTIGAGGNYFGNGSNSVFGAITAAGGGSGGGGTTPPASGGSGGGASQGGGGDGNTIGFGTLGQGNDGGKGWTGGGGATNNATGGGGGAGTRGISVNPTAGGYGAIGGAGVASNITGTLTAYAGGGNGAGNYGGNTEITAARTASGTAGAANKGSGAGAGDYIAGGSGIVIVRHLVAYADAILYSPATKTTANGYTVYTFLSSGSITF